MPRQLNRRDFLRILSALSITALSGCKNNSQNEDANDFTTIPISEYRTFRKEGAAISYRGRINDRFVLSEGSIYDGCPNYYPQDSKEIYYGGTIYEVGEVNDTEIKLRPKR